MYIPITIAPLFSLIPYALANGCHVYSDSIGCSTVLGDGSFSDAITDFCTNHLKDPGTGQELTLPIGIGTSWPGNLYSLPIYTDEWQNQVMFWANFRVDRTADGEPYTLTYDNCITLLGQAQIGNGTNSPSGPDCQWAPLSSWGGWGNTDFGTVFAEPICPDDINCLPQNLRPLWGC